MKDLKEQRVCDRFCSKFIKNVHRSVKILQKARGEDGVSRTQYYEEFSRFKTGRILTYEDRRPRQPSTPTNDNNNNAVRAMIHAV